jgi:hypothetical protein
MTHAQDLTTGSEEPMIYQIRVKGHLSSRWRRWFEPMIITPQTNGDTLLTGPVVDQAALHAVLTRVRDLGIPLISVTRIDADGSGTSIATPCHVPTSE